MFDSSYNEMVQLDAFSKYPTVVRCTLRSEHRQTSLTCLLREGYRSAAGFLAHVREVKEDLEAIIKQVGKERVKVSRIANSLQISVQIQTSRRFVSSSSAHCVQIVCCGPPSELEKIKPHMDGRLSVKYAELDSGALQVILAPHWSAAHNTVL